MIVYTMIGKSIVSLEETDGMSLFDNNKVEWARCPEYDSQNPRLIGYRETVNNVSVIQLTIEEMKRIIKGPHAMQTPTTVLEMRYFAMKLPRSYQWIIDQWQDQKLREILIEAEDNHRHPGEYMKSEVEKILKAETDAKKTQEEQVIEEDPEEATGKPEKIRKTSRTGRNITRSRKQEGSVSVTFGSISIILTPKQLEFMERLSEHPEWKKLGINGKYVASEYAEELSDTMNPMSVGAVITTLREKGILITERTRIGGVKCCMFQLTDTGIQIYNKLVVEGAKLQ